MKDFHDKTAVVTGAASGIGRAFAERFVAEGMKVVLADHDAASLERVTQALAEKGGRVLAVRTDVADGAAVSALAARTKEAFGPVHLLCNNAGVGGGTGPLWTLTENDWQWTLSVNLWGVIHGIRAFVPDMIAHGDEAHVINTASMAGLSSPTFMGPYVASKHGVVAISEVLARDLTAFGARVKVSVLCPGFVRTGIAETEQHRPAHLKNAAPATGATQAAQKGVADAIRKLVEHGKSPEEVAGHVVDAVRAEQFYVLPHAKLKGLVRDRLEDVMQNRYPRFDPHQLAPERNPQ